MTDDRRARIAAAFMSLSADMKEMGIAYATLVLDPDGDIGVLTYAGNLSLEAADELFAAYVRGRPDSKVRNTLRIMQQNDLTQ